MFSISKAVAMSFILGLMLGPKLALGSSTQNYPILTTIPKSRQFPQWTIPKSGQFPRGQFPKWTIPQWTIPSGQFPKWTIPKVDNTQSGKFIRNFCSTQPKRWYNSNLFGLKIFNFSNQPKRWYNSNLFGLNKFNQEPSKKLTNKKNHKDMAGNPSTEDFDEFNNISPLTQPE